MNLLARTHGGLDMKDETILKEQWLKDCGNDPAAYYDADEEEQQEMYEFWKIGWNIALEYTDKHPDADGDDAEDVTETLAEGFNACCWYLGKCKGGA